jgi:hypothetical protein
MSLPRTLLLLVIAVLVGCVPPQPSPRVLTPATEASRASLLVDYSRGPTATSACSGTLLSPRVVLTAATCVTPGAAGRVSLVGKNHRSVLVQRSITYASHASKTPDTALLVLRQPITLARYPRVLASSCLTCEVVHVGRTGAGIVASAPATLRASASSRQGAKLVLTNGHDRIAGRGRRRVPT